MRAVLDVAPHPTGRQPIQIRVHGFLFSRSAMEIVNTIAGIMVGGLMLVPGEMLATSQAFRGLLHIWPEVVWGALLLGSGVGCFLAWWCRQYHCRVFAMLVWVWGWLFLTAQVYVTLGVFNVFFGTGTALAIGSMMQAVRLIKFGQPRPADG